MLLALAFESQSRDFSQGMEKMLLLSITAAAISLDLGVVRFVEWPHITALALCKPLFSPCCDPMPLAHVPRQSMCLFPMVVLLPTNILQFPSSVLMLVFAEMDPQGLATLFKFVFNSANGFASFRGQWQTLAFSTMTVLET